MQNSEIFEKHGLTQSKLAEIIGKGNVTSKIRTRACRIWNGQRPTNVDMAIIYEATGGAITANAFYGLNGKINGKPK